jgi:GTPase Era involved in 16S rRNA processing
MPVRHGAKVYCQLLLDTNRYIVAETLAESRGKKVTALLREYVYAALEEEMPDMYKIAKEADEKRWIESVQARVAARRESQKTKKQQEDQ